MSTFLQTIDGDLDLTGGRLTLVKDPVWHAAIKLRNRFLFSQGEWFLDTRLGVPYYSVILVKNPDLGVVRRVFTEVILSVSPVIDTVDEMNLDVQPDRTLRMTFKCTAVDGQTIEGGLGQPFLVNGEPLVNQ